MRARLLRRESGGDSGPSAPGLELVSLCASLSSAWMRARSHCASPLLLSCPDPSGPSLRVNGPAAAPPPPSLLHTGSCDISSAYGRTEFGRDLMSPAIEPWVQKDAAACM